MGCIAAYPQRRTKFIHFAKDLARLMLNQRNWTDYSVQQEMGRIHFREKDVMD